MSIFVLYVGFVFFFKQKTAYEMRISDWSSDVCSSDLIPPGLSRAVCPGGLTAVLRIAQVPRIGERGDQGECLGAVAGRVGVVGAPHVGRGRGGLRERRQASNPGARRGRCPLLKFLPDRPRRRQIDRKAENVAGADRYRCCRGDRNSAV